MKGLRICLGVLVIIGCSLDDDMRCPDGFAYEQNTRTCVKDEDIETDTDTDTGIDSETGTPSDSDGGPQDDAGPDDNIPTGYGQTCSGPAECASFEANYCGIIPGAAAGYCTIENCVPADCPAGSQCCDCSSINFPIICAKDADVEGLIGSFCNCQ